MAQNQTAQGSPTKAFGNSPKSLKKPVPDDDFDVELEKIASETNSLQIQFQKLLTQSMRLTKRCKEL